MSYHSENSVDFSCEICDYKRKKPMLLQKNMKNRHTDERRGAYACHMCDYQCSGKKILDQHKLSRHSEEKPYQCHQCDKKFKLKGTLTVHLQTHSNERRFQCKKCEKNFKSRCVLCEHEKNGPQNLCCELCFYRTNLKTNLLRHKKIHS